MAYNKKVELFLSHAENRIRICLSNILLFSAKGEKELADDARASFLSCVGKAQDWHQEEHF